MSSSKNALKVILLALTLFSGNSAFAKPKKTQVEPTPTRHPKVLLMSFTFTMTDFAFKRLSNAEGIADGISQHICGSVSGLLGVGEHKDYVWSNKGRYVNPDEPKSYYIYFPAGRYDSNVSDIVDVTADDVRDIFGADAISNVREIPYEDFQRQQQAKERVQIIDALKLSAGNVPQTAVRLGMQTAELQKKIVEYGIDARKR